MEDKDSNLEKYFRGQFSKDVKQEAWNNPPEFVWTNINKELDKKPDWNKWLRFVPLFVLFLILPFLFQMFKSNQLLFERIEKLESDIEDCKLLSISKTAKNKIEESKISTNIKNRTFLVEKESLSKKLKTKSKLASSTLQNQIVPSSQQNDLKNIDDKTQTAKNYEQNKSLNQPVEIDTPFRNESYTKNFSTDNTKKEHEEPQILASSEFLKLKINELPIKEKTVSHFLALEQIKKKSKHSGYLGLSSRYVYWIDQVSGNTNNPLSELLITERTKPSFEYGIQAIYCLTDRLNLNIGTSLNIRNQKSVYFLHLPYTLNSETIDSKGDYVNRFKHSLPTGLGNVQTDLLLIRNKNNTVIDNELIDLDFSFNNESVSVVMPVTVSYFPIRSNSGLFISVGFQNEFHIRNRITNVYTLSHHTYVKNKESIVEFEQTQIKSYNISALTGLGYKLNFYKGSSLFLSCDYGFGLNTIYSNASYRHNLNQLSFSVGLLKSLNF